MQQNNMIMTDRIQMILKSMNLSPSQFADEISVQRSSLSHILSGRNKPSLDFVTKVLTSYPEISTEWLLFGKGTMIKKSEKPKSAIPQEEKPARDIVMEEKKEPVKEKEKVNLTEVPARIAPGHQQSAGEKDVGEIIMLYSDNTFRVFKPAKEKE